MKTIATSLVLLLAASTVGCADDSTSSREPSPPGGPQGDGGFTPAATPDALINAILDAHNEVRANAQPTPAPPFSPFVWSEELAALAQKWADNCVFAHNSQELWAAGHGQNITAHGGSSGQTTDAALVVRAKETVQGWASEASAYTYGPISISDSTFMQTGHYTQIVWRNTTKVGCGYESCPLFQLWVCEYEPAGNVPNQLPY